MLAPLTADPAISSRRSKSRRAGAKRLSTAVGCLLLVLLLSGCAEEEWSVMNMPYDQLVMQGPTPPYIPPAATAPSVGFVQTESFQGVLGSVRLQQVDGKMVLGRSYMPESQTKAAYDAGSRMVEQPGSRPVEFIAVPAGRHGLTVSFLPGMSVGGFLDDLQGRPMVHRETMEVSVRPGHHYTIRAEVDRQTRAVRIWIRDANTGGTVESSYFN